MEFKGWLWEQLSLNRYHLMTWLGTTKLFSIDAGLGSNNQWFWCRVPSLGPGWSLELGPMPGPILNDLPHFERLYSGRRMEFKSIPGSNLPQVQIPNITWGRLEAKATRWIYAHILKLPVQIPNKSLMANLQFCNMGHTYLTILSCNIDLTKWLRLQDTLCITRFKSRTNH